jgi:hypothetical protein
MPELTSKACNVVANFISRQHNVQHNDIDGTITAMERRYCRHSFNQPQVVADALDWPCAVGSHGAKSSICVSGRLCNAVICHISHRRIP